MAKLLKILTIPNPKLNRLSREIKKITPEVKELIKNMVYTMRQVNGVGLSAPQIGQLKRISIIEYQKPSNKEKEIPLLILINPQISWLSKTTYRDEEGCLSLPKIFGLVERAKKIKISFIDKEGKPQKMTAENLLARIIQHETDHLDGILFPQRMKGGDKLYAYEVKEKGQPY